VTISVTRPRVDPPRIDALVRAQSLIWLKSAEGLFGFEGRTDADQNLAGLAALVRRLARNGQFQARRIELFLEGRAVQVEQARIRAALADIVESRSTRG
jgi:hypothetical protein